MAAFSEDFQVVIMNVQKILTTVFSLQKEKCKSCIDGWTQILAHRLQIV